MVGTHQGPRLARRVRKVDLPDAKPRGSKRLVADSEHKVNVTPPSDVTALLSWTLWTLF